MAGKGNEVVKMSRRRRKKRSAAGVFLKTLVIVLVIAGILFYAKGFVKQKVEDKVAETVVDQIATSDVSLPDGGSAGKIYSSMSTEDQEKVKKIVDNHMNTEAASKVQQFVTSGDKEGLKQYAQESLTQEEQDELQELYNKYKDGAQ